MYTLYKLAQLALWPELWIAGLLLCALFLARDARHLRAVRGLLFAALAIFWLGGSAAVCDRLAFPLEQNSRVGHLTRSGEAGAAADAIVVLAGGETANQQRLLRGVRLWREAAAPLLVLSGGPANPFESNFPVAEPMRRLALALGVPPEAVRLESRSRNTEENARETRRLLPDARRIVLVTSAMHVRRAAAAFRAQGFTVDPVAAEQPQGPQRSPYDYLPDAGVLEHTRAAVHEYAGLASRALVRWTGVGKKAPEPAPR